MVQTESVIANICQQDDKLLHALVQHHFPEQWQQYSASVDVAEDPKSSYLQQVSTWSSPAVPYDYLDGAPPSVLFTSTALANLLDLGLTAEPVVLDLARWLLRRQENGWWVNPELLDYEVPPWHKPDNMAVKIFLTSVTSGVLARYHDIMVEPSPSSPLLSEIESSVGSALSRLDQFRGDNGALLGMPHSSWFVTPAIAMKYGQQSKQFLQHWSILDQFITVDPDPESLQTDLTIARQLQLAGIPAKDPLYRRCLSHIRALYRSHEGWYQGDSIDARSSLVALLLLDQSS